MSLLPRGLLLHRVALSDSSASRKSERGHKVMPATLRDDKFNAWLDGEVDSASAGSPTRQS
jgi:hypothetical protein